MTYFFTLADPIPDDIKNADEKRKHEWLFQNITEIAKK